MMASPSAFNCEDTCSMTVPTESDPYLEAQVGITTARVPDAKNMGILGCASARHPQQANDLLLNEAVSGNYQASVEGQHQDAHACRRLCQ